MEQIPSHTLLPLKSVLVEKLSQFILALMCEKVFISSRRFNIYIAGLCFCMRFLYCQCPTGLNLLYLFS